MLQSVDEIDSVIGLPKVFKTISKVVTLFLDAIEGDVNCCVHQDDFVWIFLINLLIDESRNVVLL